MTTTECNMKFTFDKEVTGIKVNGGKNERCEGNVCTLTHRFSRALKEGQKIDLLHRVRFAAPGRSQLTEFEFNGVKICGIEETESIPGPKLREQGFFNDEETGSRTETIENIAPADPSVLGKFLKFSKL